MFDYDEYAKQIKELGQHYSIHEEGSKDYSGEDSLPEKLIQFLKEAKVFENIGPNNSGNGIADVNKWFVALREIGSMDNTSAHIMTTQSMDIFALQIAGEAARLSKELEEMIALDKISCFCLTEAESGSDLSNMMTYATKTDHGYILNGEKIMIMDASVADYFLIAARLSGTTGSEGVTLFLAEKGDDGISVLPHDKTCGVTGVPINTVQIKNLFVQNNKVIGEPGNGLKYIMETLNHTRPGVGAAALGEARTAIEMAAAYGEKRVCFGKPLNKNPILQAKMADMLILWRSAWLLVEKAAEGIALHKKDFAVTSAMAKICGTSAAKQIVDIAMEFFGGRGYLKEFGIERMYRDLRGPVIYDGANDILKTVIAKSQIKYFLNGDNII